MRREDHDNLKTPYPASEDPEVGFGKAIGVHTPEVDDLYREIFNDLSDTAFGVGWWEPHPGTTRRILISHYLVECVRSIGTNLTEAALHLLEAVDFWDKESDFLANCISRGPDGKPSVKMPPRKAPAEDLARRMATLHAVGFFRGLASALDCLGASIVGILALPTDIRHATLKIASRSLEKVNTQIQIDFRTKLNQIVTGAGPIGWDDWVIDLRNMVVHRGRRWHLNQLVPRQVRILGPDGRTILRMMAVEHLPSDPYRSQIEALVDKSRDHVLTEHGETTMRGALASALEVIRNSAVELIHVWRVRRQNPSLIIQPRKNWPHGLCVKSTNFLGYKPGSLSYDPKLVIPHSDIARQFKTAALADNVRDRWDTFD